MWTRCMMTVSWPSRAADCAMREYGTLLNREKFLRSTSALDMTPARGESGCYNSVLAT